MHLFAGGFLRYIQHITLAFFGAHAVAVVKVNYLQLIPGRFSIALIKKRLGKSQHQGCEEQQPHGQQPFIPYLALFTAVELDIFQKPRMRK